MKRVETERDALRAEVGSLREQVNNQGHGLFVADIELKKARKERDEAQKALAADSAAAAARAHAAAAADRAHADAAAYRAHADAAAYRAARG